MRLLHRRHGLRETALHPVLHRAWEPPGARSGRHPASKRRLGRAAGAPALVVARRPSLAATLPDPRSRLEVQRRLRRGLRQRGDRDRPNTDPSSAGQTRLPSDSSAPCGASASTGSWSSAVASSSASCTPTSIITTAIVRFVAWDSCRHSRDLLSASPLPRIRSGSAAGIDSVGSSTSTARPREPDRVNAPHGAVVTASRLGRDAARPLVRQRTTEFEPTADGLYRQ